MRRARLALAVLALALPLALGACGDSDAPADTGSGQETKTIDITIDGDSVTPNGDRVEVGVRPHLPRGPAGQRLRGAVAGAHDDTSLRSRSTRRAGSSVARHRAQLPLTSAPAR